MKEYNGKHDHLNEDKLKAYKNGRVWRIPKESLVKYVLENSKL